MPGEPAPSMFTIKALEVEEPHDSMEVLVPLAVRVALVELNGLQLKPAGMVPVRAIAPAKLNLLVNTIVEVIKEPGFPLGDVLLMEKSPT